MTAFILGGAIGVILMLVVVAVAVCFARDVEEMD